MRNKALFLFGGELPPVLLAPMAGVTDAPFRELCVSFGADLAFSEMVSAKGLFYGGGSSGELTAASEREDHLAVQLFGSEPKLMADMAKRLEERMGDKLALIDINMGCPARKIVSNGEGSALMQNVPLASRIICTVAKAASVPVSVKFRKGFDEAHINAVEFAQMAGESGASFVTVHGRTREQQYSGRADWDIIAQAKRASSVPLIGNGDIFCGADAVKMLEYTGCDGVMVGRGAMGAPYIFKEIKAALAGESYVPPTAHERIALAKTHARRLCELKGDGAIIEMRKHVSWYLRGFCGSSSIRAKANEIRSLTELYGLLDDFDRATNERGEPLP